MIAGHVDSPTGPGVFFALEGPGPAATWSTVGRSDGRTAHYRVTDGAGVDKDRFPTEQVYGPTAGAELRLITCGGSFDRAAGHYLRNVVVSGGAGRTRAEPRSGRAAGRSGDYAGSRPRTDDDRPERPTGHDVTDVTT